MLIFFHINLIFFHKLNGHNLHTGNGDNVHYIFGHNPLYSNGDYVRFQNGPVGIMTVLMGIISVTHNPKCGIFFILVVLP